MLRETEAAREVSTGGLPAVAAMVVGAAMPGFAGAAGTLKGSAQVHARFMAWAMSATADGPGPNDRFGGCPDRA